MKNQTGIGRRELFRRLAGCAAALALPASSALAQQSPASSSDSATVRIILADGTTVQWLAVTNGGMTVGGTTTISSAFPGINKSTILAAIAAIEAAGGPKLTTQQVTLLGGRTV